MREIHSIHNGKIRSDPTNRTLFKIIKINFNQIFLHGMCVRHLQPTLFFPAKENGLICIKMVRSNVREVADYRCVL